MERGISQQQLAEQLGVTRQTLSNWERGQTFPDSLQCDVISRQLNVGVDFLFDQDKRDENVMKRKNGVHWLFLVILNIIMTVAMFAISANQYSKIIGKLIIVAGPPIIISVIVWGVLQHALNSEDYNLIL